MPPANTVVDMGLSHYLVQQLPRGSGIRSLLPSAAGGQRGSAAWRGGAGPCHTPSGVLFAENNFKLFKIAFSKS